VNVYGFYNADLKNIRVACMCLLCYAGFLRFAELANLRRHHVFIYDNHVKLFLESSKTDVYREGRDVLISKTNTPTCPVNMLLRYFYLAEIPADSTDYIFRPLCFCKSVNSYKLRSGKLSYTTAREILLSALETLGLNKKYFGLHSLRSGGATATAAAKVEDRLLKKHGRWRTDKAKDGYVKENISEKLSVTQNIGLKAPFFVLSKLLHTGELFL
jgi:integrase